MDYQKQAKDFCEKYNVKITSRFIGNDYHFKDDKETRDIYEVTISREGETIKLRFGQSIANSGTKFKKGKKPTEYEVLCCLQKYPLESFKTWCYEFGYDEDSRSALETYLACQKEYDNVVSLFDDDSIEELKEIN